MGELDGKVAVITGAGSGMGRASAEVFAREGAKILAVDVTGRQDDTASDLGDGVVACQCDVSNESEVVAMFATALDTFGRVDAVLNVAGIGGFGMLAELPLEEYDRVLNVNLKGVMLGTKHGINAMIPTGGGSIVNWASIGGLGASPGTSAYSASKAGVISFTKSAAVEYGMQGVRANAVCPGFVETALTGGPGSGARFPQLIEASALKRAGQPEEVAELASFLASDRASFITGAVISIDGGTTAKIG
jgi:NAD(P)-dependent dehydrogenase (short-subunit alcohol dehydrogenase family)